MVFGETSFKTMQTNFKSVVFFLLRKKIQNIWHFCISSRFSQAINISLWDLQIKIAQIFKDHFQIMYAYDGKKTNHPHIHFAVNAYSYYPTVPALTKARFYFLSRKSKAASKERIPEYRSANSIKEDFSKCFEGYDDILTIEEVAEALRIGSSQAYRIVRSNSN